MASPGPYKCTGLSIWKRDWGKAPEEVAVLVVMRTADYLISAGTRNVLFPEDNGRVRLGARKIFGFVVFS